MDTKIVLLVGALLVGTLVIAAYFLLSRVFESGVIDGKYLEAAIGSKAYYLTVDTDGSVGLGQTKTTKWTYDTSKETLSANTGPTGTILAVFGDPTASDPLDAAMKTPVQTYTFWSQWTVTKASGLVTIALKSGNNQVLSYYINATDGSYVVAVPTASTPVINYAPMALKLVS